MKILNYKITNSNKGVSLYLALVIVSLLLGVALGLSSILLGQTSVVKEIGNSVIAFYAADTGLEQVLMNRNNPSDIPSTPLFSHADYQVTVSAGGSGDCPAANNFCIKAVGTYWETRRAIQITY
jgi:hypothetical protein